jgi:hypothetical protein
MLVEFHYTLKSASLGDAFRFLLLVSDPIEGCFEDLEKLVFDVACVEEQVGAVEGGLEFIADLGEEGGVLDVGGDEAVGHLFGPGLLLPLAEDELLLVLGELEAARGLF